MGLQEGMRSESDKIHGKGRIGTLQDKPPEESEVVSFRSNRHTQPLFLVRFPESQPFIELLFRDIKTFTELFNGTESGKVFPQNKEDEEQTIAGVRNNDIRKNSMCVLAAVAEYAHDTKMLFVLLTQTEVNDRTVIIIVDMTVSGTSTDGTCFRFSSKLLHIGVKKRF